jgi:hypothetical protein
LPSGIEKENTPSPAAFAGEKFASNLVWVQFFGEFRIKGFKIVIILVSPTVSMYYIFVIIVCESQDYNAERSTTNIEYYFHCSELLKCIFLFEINLCLMANINSWRSKTIYD